MSPFKGCSGNIFYWLSVTFFTFLITPQYIFAQQSSMVSTTLTNSKTMSAYSQNYSAGNTQEKIALIKGLPNTLSQFSRKDSLSPIDTILMKTNRVTAKQILQSALKDQSEELNLQAMNSITENNFNDLTADVLAVYNTASFSIDKRAVALRTLASLDYPQLLPLVNAVLQSKAVEKLTWTALIVAENKQLCKALPNIKRLVQKAKDLNTQFIKDKGRQSDELVELSERAESVFQQLVSNGPCN
ncbi:MAG: hypothetical protein PHC61_00205 [Chitinivibrionales bacterium]|nr:hypothetical protein [Chitinivibrionales bacterium]